MFRTLALLAVPTLLLAACVPGGEAFWETDVFGRKSPAEVAWRAGDFVEARRAAAAKMEIAPDDMKARRLFILASAALGDSRGAIGAYAAGVKREDALDEALLWSYFRLGDMAGARAFAEKRNLLRNPAIAEQIRLATERPMRVTLSGAVELSYAQDGFTQYLPGAPARLNGRPTVVRFDTGGSFVHMTRSQAASFGVSYAGCERSFAALQYGEVCYGVADLQLGEARIENVMVSVHPDDTFPTIQIAQAFGVEMGPIIGTNVFAQFLTSFDASGQRLILSPRDDPDARRRHEGLISGTGSPVEVPFGVIGSHYLIARGLLGNETAIFFIDSGVAAMNRDQGQAAFLMSKSRAARMGLARPEPGRFAEISQPAGFASALASPKLAFVVPDRMWRGYGDWSGIDVASLIAHAYLKDFIWTLDFERNVLVLRKASAK